MALPPALQGLAARYKALPRNQQLGVLFGIPVVVACVFGYLAWGEMGKNGEDPNVYPILRRAGVEGNLWTQINDVNGQVEVQRQKAAKRQVLEARLRELNEQTAEIESMLPRDEEKSEIRQTIQTLAREVPAQFGQINVKSVRIDEGSGTGKGDYRTVLYQVEVEGDLNGIISFIDSIEKPSLRNQRFMSVNKINWRAGNVDEDQKSSSSKAQLKPHTVQLDVLTYIYTPKGKK